MSSGKKKEAMILEIDDGMTASFVHIENCIEKWETKEPTYQFWVHCFVNSLGPIPSV